MEEERFNIIYNCLYGWYGETWAQEDLEDIAQDVAIHCENDFEDILDKLLSQMGDSVESGELDGLALQIFKDLQNGGF